MLHQNEEKSKQEKEGQQRFMGAMKTLGTKLSLSHFNEAASCCKLYWLFGKTIPCDELR